MDDSQWIEPPNTLGGTIRRLREERGLTREELGGVEFSPRYIRGIEEGTVRPSHRVLELLAHRLHVPPEELLAVQATRLHAPEAVAEPPVLDMEAQMEEFEYLFKYGKMLIRTNQVEEAWRLVDEYEQEVSSQADRLPRRVSYQFNFLRGRLYLQMAQPTLARPYIEEALRFAEPESEDEARVRNMLGVIHYELDEPGQALAQHLKCLDLILMGVAKDRHFHLSVYQNLGNAYWALNKLPQAIDAYKKALDLLRDLNEVQNEADVLWGLTLAYDKMGDWERAMWHGMRALDIYREQGNKARAAATYINLAEMLVKRSRYEDAAPLLQSAEEMLEGEVNQGLWSALYRQKAELARHLGRIEQAADYATQSVELASALYAAAQTKDVPVGTDQPWVIPARAYAEALHTMALIEKERGNAELADRLFRQAIQITKNTSLRETLYNISSSYADMLRASGQVEQAVEYYRMAAESRPRYTIGKS